MCTGYPFNRHQQYGRAECIPFHRQQYRRAWCIPFHHQQLVPHFTSSSVNVQGVCISFFKCRNAGLSGIPFSPVPEQTKMPTPVPEKGGPSQVPECSGTGLRERITGCRCQCRRHRTRCRCSAVVAMALCQRHPDRYSTSAWAIPATLFNRQRISKAKDKD
jgi:hypothetical protein